MYTFTKMQVLLGLARKRAPLVEHTQLVRGCTLRSTGGTRAIVRRVVQRGVWVQFWRDGEGWQHNVHYVDRSDLAHYTLESVPTCEHGPRCDCPTCLEGVAAVALGDTNGGRWRR
jgi:hypothetical protein